MSIRKPISSATDQQQCHLLILALASHVAGACAGLVGALFRLSLDHADRFRDSVLSSSQSYGAGGLLLVVAACAFATAIAAWLVERFSPEASGSGIPHVEAVLLDERPPTRMKLVPVKFLGGLLAIGSGLALGREGPTVQMGASISHLLGRKLGLSGVDNRSLLAAGAGAGLATAFNAPIAGAVFVLEELVRKFDTRMTIATFGASTGAITVARLLLGDRPDFDVEMLPFPTTFSVSASMVLGVVLGVLGVAYNRAILGAISLSKKLQSWPVVMRAAAIGGSVGLLAWYAPQIVGGGDPITQNALNLKTVAFMLPLAFLIRFGLGAISYAAATPGGLFAPMLVLGAQAGLMFGNLCQTWVPAVTTNPTTYAVTAMAAFFTAVVRAPLTGIILVIELTGSYTQLLPMLAACFSAMLIPTLWKDPPIYDSLKPPVVNDE
ncbi:H(+)/Cl(-) exchange transporter ClcA [Bythopirellula goksoeyrii]|uniref:H(+)/Cl(-) exchange transporter ClcA n=1 Tax=Bythopirellula goksoeyrii TaxID=1400387 RepID=A0A5B9Q2I6_9BACT|nr:H(+)/Cl(-) exchange transporter ClcA [Bythopirellula goksoeyrii]QEG33237.1 H(+)/Cl(-) exchange transporter ClcA [Bythopirellula goksoeyrii]